MKKERLEEILESFKELKVAVIGDMMLDDYLIGTVERISPEAPVPVVSIKEERFVLGGASNVVNNLATLGAKTVCFGVIGNDFDGERLLKELSDKGIETDDVIKDDKRPTIVKRRVIGENQQLLRLDWEDNSPISVELEDKILNRFKERVDELNAVILSDYDKGVLTERVVKEVIKICNEKGIIVVVDPKPKNTKNYMGATSMTPNRKEARECLGTTNLKDIVEIGKELKNRLNLKNLLLTRSEEGISVFEGDEVFNIPTYAKEVYDVTGAGDTVISVYTLACASGVSLKDSAKIANTAAGIVVGKVGTSTVTKEEIIEFYNRIYNEWK